MNGGALFYIATFLSLFCCGKSIVAQPDTTVAHNFYREATINVEKQNLNKAINMFGIAAQAFKESNYPDRTIDCYLSKCELLLELNQTNEISTILDSCKILIDEVNIPRKHSKNKLRLILLDQQLLTNDSIRSLRLKEAYTLVEENSSLKSSLGYSLYQQLGNFYFAREQFDSCNFYMDLALNALPENLNDRETEGDICLQWAKSLRRVGDLQKAFNLINQAIAVYISSLGPNHTKVATGYNDLAIIQNMMGDAVNSGNSFSRALKIREKLFGRHTNEYATVLNNATLYYLGVGNHSRALAYARETVSIFETIKNPDKRFHVASYNTLAKVYEALGDFTLAEENFQKAVNLHQIYFPGNSRIRFYYIDMGKNAMLRQEFEEAVFYFHQAMSYAIPGIDPDDLSQIPSENDPSNYLTLKTLCLLKANALHKLFHVNEDTSTLAQAIELYNLADIFAVKNRTEVRFQKSRIAFSKQNLELYENAILAHMEMWKKSGDIDHLNRSFILSEKSKSLTLLEDLLEANALKNSDLPEDILSREGEIQDSLLYYRNQLGEALNSSDKLKEDSFRNLLFHLNLLYDDFKKDIEKSFPRFYQSKYELNFLSPDLVRRGLQESQSLIEYFVGQENIFVFIINDKISEGHILAKPDSLQQSVTGLIESVQTFDFSRSPTDSDNEQKIKAYINYATYLFDALWMPFIDDLTETITIVPDAILNYLPFGILLNKAPDIISEFRNYNYLEKDYTISYNYSATLGRQMVEGKLESNTDFLVIAPEFKETTGAALGQLLFNLEEAQEVSHILHSDLLTGGEALKEQFKKKYKKYGSFHFATHAIVDENDSDFSFLAFEDDTDPKSRLYLQELYATSIPAYVVTLSACRTNVGPLLQGEGIASLAKGFSYAGAKSIITSMWDVDDQSTKDIMTFFYQNLVEEKDKDSALRAAKLRYLDRSDHIFAHPYFWATFIAIGDMSPLQIPTRFSTLFTYLVPVFLILIFILIIYFRKK